jgi:hypothetical protein
MALDARGQRVLAWGTALFLFVVLMIVTPRIPQDQKYHQFADRRNFIGVPNTLNVISNFPFLVIGIVGLVLTIHGNNFGFSLKGEVLGWAAFFVGITATSFGSAYYHLNPNDARLVWDRLPVCLLFSIMWLEPIRHCMDILQSHCSLLFFITQPPNLYTS